MKIGHAIDSSLGCLGVEAELIGNL
jgi:hypothetical protein